MYQRWGTLCGWQTCSTVFRFYKFDNSPEPVGTVWEKKISHRSEGTCQGVWRWAKPFCLSINWGDDSLRLLPSASHQHLRPHFVITPPTFFYRGRLPLSTPLLHLTSKGNNCSKLESPCISRRMESSEDSGPTQEHQQQQQPAKSFSQSCVQLLTLPTQLTRCTGVMSVPASLWCAQRSNDSVSIAATEKLIVLFIPVQAAEASLR